MRKMSVWLCSSAYGTEVNLFLKTEEGFERLKRLLDPGSLIRQDEYYESFDLMIEGVKLCVFSSATRLDTLSEKPE